MKNKALLFLPTVLVVLLSSCQMSGFNDFFKPTDGQGGSGNNQLVISGNYKTVFEYGESFNVDGMVVTCGNEVITGVSYFPFIVGNRLNQAGEFEITVSKANYKSAYYDITVNPAKALTIKTQPTKVDYVTGDLFDSTGLEVIDENSNPVTDYTISIADGTMLKFAGDQTVTISKDGYMDASFTIHVIESGGGSTTNVDLTFYYLNDFHGCFAHLNRYNEPGMSVISKYIRDHVSENPDYSLVLSGGDMFQGGYESNESRGMVLVDAMNIIGFDAMALGNHEFDWGEEAIENISEALDFPILSSNTFYSSSGKNPGERPEWLSPYTIVQKGDVKVGIIGGAQYNLGSSIDGTISSSFSFPSPNAYIMQYSTQLRKNEGCDVVVALFHDEGYDTDKYETEPTKFSDITQIDSSTGLPYVDAMFFSHDHMRKAGKYNNIPYIEAQSNGKYIGELTLSLVGNGVYYTVEDSSVNNVNATYLSTNDPDIDAITTKPEYASIMSKADEVIYNFSKQYSKEEFTIVACMAMYWFVNNNKSEFGDSTVYFASHNTGGVRSIIYSGNFTMRDMIKVFPFDNPLVIQTCNSSNINYMRNSDYYRTYEASDIIYEGGYTKAVTITYISEYRVRPDGSNSCQVSRVIYTKTAKEALYSYLKSGVNTSL